MSKLDWSKTQAVWDGEDWLFTGVPLDACPNWGGTTCFNQSELNCYSKNPADAIDALMYWCEHGESQPDNDGRL